MAQFTEPTETVVTDPVIDEDKEQETVVTPEPEQPETPETEPDKPVETEPLQPSEPDTEQPETAHDTPQGSKNEEQPETPVTEPETPAVNLFDTSWIYIKIVDGEARAFGDLASIRAPKEKGGAGDATLSYDYRLTPEEWANYEYTARVETATPKVATLAVAANAVDTQALEATETEEPKYSRTVQLASGPKIIIGKTNAEKLKEQQDFIRLVRDTKLRKCDKMSPMRWYGMTEEQKQEWANYRQALLDIPQQSGFPWEGDMDKAPWPTEPK